ncbi:MAG: hypothetical protein JRN06_01105 [Nitrososphaerota archaeon]|nr:hypothetical protein [Nitrososphaerota archaeon]MDG7023550.1 hypothetical protein [Nitrososphaerota archaeon]
MCIQAPMADAMATGTKDLTLNSNNRSSIARRTAAMGVPKVAAIPAAAPEAKRIFLSAPVMLTACPMKEPKAPPVWIMGPSAPKG